MSISSRFNQLKDRLDELRANLLPEEFSATGDYSSREQDLARGYRLLAHAEMESYLEDISKENVILAIRNWKTDKNPSVVLVAFLASYHSSWSTTDETHNNEIIQLARSRAYHYTQLSPIVG